MKATVAIMAKLPERQGPLVEMLNVLNLEKVNAEGRHKLTGRIFADPKPKDTPWSQFKTELADKQWGWSLQQGSEYTHHLFLTDDLNIYPHGFFDVLEAMIVGSGKRVIGLVSNHPKGPGLYREGKHAYRCNSWLTGPAYLVDTPFLAAALSKYRSLDAGPESVRGTREWFNDDSFLNECVTTLGPGESWHPLPTIVEHRIDIPSTVGHGDRYSRERVSWREERTVIGGSDFRWECRELYPHDYMTGRLYQLMGTSKFWETEAPMLPVNNPEG
jgi:hypothetical protein